jgi:hypothetical protein
MTGRRSYADVSHETNQDIADKAVKKVFAILGVDIDKPESIEEFREDLRFGRRMRKLADHGSMALIGTLVAGMCVAIWAGIASIWAGIASKTVGQ